MLIICRNKKDLVHAAHNSSAGNAGNLGKKIISWLFGVPCLKNVEFDLSLPQASHRYWDVVCFNWLKISISRSPNKPPGHFSTRTINSKVLGLCSPPSEVKQWKQNHSQSGPCFILFGLSKTGAATTEKQSRCQLLLLHPMSPEVSCKAQPLLPCTEKQSRRSSKGHRPLQLCNAGNVNG